MQPDKPADERIDGFKPKWRHFSPLSRVWVQNPFDHDVIFQVADEYNRRFKYIIPAMKVAELPGGSIATLGVKKIVDELVQNTKGDEMRMWDENVRRKHEDNIIVRIKETRPAAESMGEGGVVDLSVSDGEVAEVEQPKAKEPEAAFPGLNEAPAPGTGGNYEPTLDPLPAEAKAGLDDLVAASLPKGDAVASVNNAHADTEG